MKKLKDFSFLYFSPSYFFNSAWFTRTGIKTKSIEGVHLSLGTSINYVYKQRWGHQNQNVNGTTLAYVVNLSTKGGGGGMGGVKNPQNPANAVYGYPHTPFH